MQQPPDTLSGKYTLRCQMPGCSGQSIVTQNFGVGWKVGDLVPMDPTNPEYGRCVKCKSHRMMVASVPEPTPRPGPKGFTKVPTK